MFIAGMDGYLGWSLSRHLTWRGHEARTATATGTGSGLLANRPGGLDGKRRQL